MNAWLMLAAAIAVEVAGTIFLKLSQGMTRWLPAAAWRSATSPRSC